MLHVTGISDTRSTGSVLPLVFPVHPSDDTQLAQTSMAISLVKVVIYFQLVHKKPLPLALLSVKPPMSRVLPQPSLSLPLHHPTTKESCNACLHHRLHTRQCQSPSSFDWWASTPYQCLFSARITSMLCSLYSHHRYSSSHTQYPLFWIIARAF